jgi:hypothetical protein
MLILYQEVLSRFGEDTISEAPAHRVQHATDQSGRHIPNDLALHIGQLVRAGARFHLEPAVVGCDSHLHTAPPGDDVSVARAQVPTGPPLPDRPAPTPAPD